MQISVKRRLLFVIATLLSVALLAPPSAHAAEPIVLPKTPVGKQVAWLLRASTHLPVSGNEAKKHLSTTFLEAATLEGFNKVFADVAGKNGIVLTSYKGEKTSATFEFVGKAQKKWIAEIAVDEKGLISALGINPTKPKTWKELRARLDAQTAQVSFATFEINSQGECKELYGVYPDVARPVASSFKLYVLGALGHAVERGKASWTEKLPIRDDWKAGELGELDELPAGTKLTLQEYAEKMISISDNTATDHLMRRVGRGSVERQQVRFEMANPAKNMPLLTTRQMTHLKSTDYPDLADEYLELTRSEKRQYLKNVIDPMPAPEYDESWVKPRSINTIEWFASPTDICNAYSGLLDQSKKPGLENVDHILSINDGGVGLDPAKWNRVWFKGGSEPGVVALNYLATNAKGRTFVVSLMVSDPEADLDEMEVAEAAALASGAFQLVK